MQRFKSINFHLIGLKLSYFCKKNTKFSKQLPLPLQIFGYAPGPTSVTCTRSAPVSYTSALHVNPIRYFIDRKVPLLYYTR